MTMVRLKVLERQAGRAQELMRAQDPASELGLAMFGAKQQDRFWEHTLRSLARRFGAEGEVESTIVCVDRRRQWSKAGNIWHSAAIRSGMYAATAPFRAVAKPFRRSSV
jgi:hypothetical protein